MLPLLPPKTHIDFTRQMYGRGRGRRQDWPDDPMYQREVTSKEIRPDPVWMAMRATFITTRSLFSRINFLRRLADLFARDSYAEYPNDEVDCRRRAPLRQLLMSTVEIGN